MLFLIDSNVWLLLVSFWRVCQIADFQAQVSELDQQLSQRTRELDVIRAELNAVKEFRRKRAQMQRELDEVSLQCRNYKRFFACTVVYFVTFHIRLVFKFSLIAHFVFWVK